MTTQLNIWVITMSDGIRLRCEPRWFGERHDPIAYRWLVISPTRSYVGPIVQRDMSPAAVQELIEGWWKTKKDLGQAERDPDFL